MKKNLLINIQGFSLIEVLIAIAIFSIFSVSFVTGLGYNLVDSGSLKDEMILKDLCESKLNEIIVNPPEFKDSLTIAKETKGFDKFPDYTYTVQYKKIPIPDISKITSGKREGSESDEEDQNQAQLKKRIFKTFKENMEKMIWQVEVTVKNKNSERSFTLSAWLQNAAAEVKIDGF